jgi:hypothetical protein
MFGASIVGFMRRHLLIIWRIANYPVGAFGLFQMFNVAGANYDDFGNEYGVKTSLSDWLQFGFGFALLALAAVSAGQNEKIRDKQSRSES